MSHGICFSCQGVDLFLSPTKLLKCDQALLQTRTDLGSAYDMAVSRSGHSLAQSGKDHFQYFPIQSVHPLHFKDFPISTWPSLGLHRHSRCLLDSTKNIFNLSLNVSLSVRNDIWHWHCPLSCKMQYIFVLAPMHCQQGIANTLILSMAIHITSFMVQAPAASTFWRSIKNTSSIFLPVSHFQKSIICPKITNYIFSLTCHTELPSQCSVPTGSS